MGTYDHKQVLVDYEKGKLTPEMAVGHSLQHIGQLYDLLKAGRQEWQSRSATQEKRVTALQLAVDRLTAIIEKARAKQKRIALSQPKSDQL